MKFKDPIFSNHLTDKFKDFGAVSEQITTFQQTDKLVLLSSVKMQVFCVGDRLKMNKHKAWNNNSVDSPKSVEG